MYTKLTNGEVDQYPYTIGQLRRDNPQVSFPKIIPDNLLSEYDVFPVVAQEIPQHDPDTQYIKTSAQPVLIDDQWTITKTAVDLSPEQIAEREAQKKQENKQQAEQLLKATDWVELNDVTDPENPPFLSNKTEFTQYRSALRTIAVNPPVKVNEWPTKPEETWSV